MTAQQTLELVRQSGVIGIVRATSRSTALEQAQRVINAGLPVVEVSLTTPGGLGVIETLVRANPDAVIGAGTVLDVTAAEAVVAAGGRIIVTPNFEPDVVRVAVRHGVAVVPGCLTPTEMTAAMRLGATAVKIFPAHLWTPAALTGMLQALPELPCVPTGGVGPDNIGQWLRAGAVAVGIGSALTAAADPAPVVAALRRRVAETRTGRDG